MIDADTTREEVIAMVEEGAPDKVNHFHKAYSGSLRSAITSMCLACRDFNLIDIRECNREACPLWEQRAYRVARQYRNVRSEKTKAESAMVEVNHDDRNQPAHS